MAVERICKQCAKRFRTYPSKVKLGRGIYCSKVCSNMNTLIIPGQRLSENTEFKKGEKHPWHKGHTFIRSRKGCNPYRLIYSPDHPNKDSRGYVREHRLIVEKHIKRYLHKDEIVHHVDGNTLNNDITNLQVMSKKEHDRMNTPLNIHKRWVEREVMPPPWN